MSIVHTIQDILAKIKIFMNMGGSATHSLCTKQQQRDSGKLTLKAGGVEVFSIQSTRRPKSGAVIRVCSRLYGTAVHVCMFRLPQSVRRPPLSRTAVDTAVCIPQSSHLSFAMTGVFGQWLLFRASDQLACIPVQYTRFEICTADV